MLAIFCLTFASCTKQDLNDDELTIENSELIYSTGGQVDDSDNLNGGS